MITLQINAQKEKLYDIDEDPSEQFKEALDKAKNEDKHVMLQIGGNWCPWCYRFHDFVKHNAELDSIVRANYILVNINFDPKQKNGLFKELEYPQRFGFPVIVITDAYGKRLHTQNSWYLEDNKDSYDLKKFKTFLKNWTPEAVAPESF